MMMQRKPGFPVANCSIKMPDSLPVESADEDGDQQHRRQQLINFGHAQWGFNNWNWAVTKQELDFVDVTNGKYCAGVVAFVSVSIKNIDIHRENIGYATSVANNKGFAIYKSRKVAVTNALRETLLSFGGSVATELSELLETTRDGTTEPLQENNQNIANTNPIHHANTNLVNTNLANTNLANTNLANTNLANTNLANTNLANTNLSNTNLANTNLSNTNLANTNLINTNLPTNLASTKIPSNLANTNHANTNHANTNHVNANLAKPILEGPPLIKNLRKNSTDSLPVNPPINRSCQPPPVKNAAPPPIAKAHPMPAPPRAPAPRPPATIPPVHPRPNPNEAAKFEGMTEEEARAERKRRQRLAQEEFRQKLLVKQGPIDEKQDRNQSSFDKLLMEIPTQDIVIEETGSSKRKSPTPDTCAKRRASVSRLDILHD